MSVHRVPLARCVDFNFSFLRRSVTLPGLYNTMKVPSSGILRPLPAEAKIFKQISCAPRSAGCSLFHPVARVGSCQRGSSTASTESALSVARGIFFTFSPLSTTFVLSSSLLFPFVSLFLKGALPRASQCTQPFSIDDGEGEGGYQLLVHHNYIQGRNCRLGVPWSR